MAPMILAKCCCAAGTGCWLLTPCSCETGGTINTATDLSNLEGRTVVVAGKCYSVAAAVCAGSPVPVTVQGVFDTCATCCGCCKTNACCFSRGSNVPVTVAYRIKRYENRLDLNNDAIASDCTYSYSATLLFDHCADSVGLPTAPRLAYGILPGLIAWQANNVPFTVTANAESPMFQCGTGGTLDVRMRYYDVHRGQNWQSYSVWSIGDSIGVIDPKTGHFLIYNAGLWSGAELTNQTQRDCCGWDAEWHSVDERGAPSPQSITTTNPEGARTYRRLHYTITSQVNGNTCCQDGIDSCDEALGDCTGVCLP